MKNNLKQLCSLHGISGHEEAVAEFIASEITPYCKHTTDGIGNLICFKEGIFTSKKKSPFLRTWMRLAFL
ncbi:MAG: hypothetical protein LBJ83_00065 [Oscillospiraceae bacterium]|jgi:putative aminopeptidase FrvX|nr:hypothetical protein [Oscillospiraceae bacterium]